jgi:hypothetical protein
VTVVEHLCTATAWLTQSGARGLELGHCSTCVVKASAAASRAVATASGDVADAISPARARHNVS